jgi:GTPase involved in cell partitioning and DNA repair
LLRKEAAAYSKELAGKPHVVVITKSDLVPDSRYPIATQDAAPVITISAAARQGLPDLLELLWKTLKS